jgi:hypothetical protein
MKICPKCQKTYEDESLNFCLEDGTVLTQQTSGGFNTPPETVLMNQPRQTFPNQQFTDQARYDWEAAPKHHPQRSGGSKNWLWVVGILGAIALVCGGGLIGLIALIANIEEKPGPNVNYNTNVLNTNTKNTNSTPDDRKKSTRIDLSAWNKDFSEFGNTDYKNDELIMSSKKDGFYYVLVAPDTYKTENATTLLTVRNINNGDNSLGYGLIFHSNPTPLKQGYAFLIDSKNQKYRIIKHKTQKEEAVVNWTKSDFIKEGSQENILEVRDEKGSINFYINGNFITSIRNTDGYKGGVTGVYVGGMSPVGFSNLEIKR